MRATGLVAAETVIEADDGFPTEVGTAFELHRLVGGAVGASRARGAFPIVLAGNCNTAAIGTVAGVGTADTGIFWFDAHDDCETPETTTSGFLDGMGLAILTGQCWRPLLRSVSGIEPLAGGRSVLIGARDISAMATRNLASAGIERIGVQDMQRNGAAASIGLVAKRLRSQGVRRLVVHVDLDVHDPEAIAPANCFAAPDGLSADEVTDMIRTASEQMEIAAISIAAYDPAFDVNDRMLATALDLVEFGARRVQRLVGV